MYPSSHFEETPKFEQVPFLKMNNNNCQCPPIYCWPGGQSHGPPNSSTPPACYVSSSDDSRRNSDPMEKYKNAKCVTIDGRDAICINKKMDSRNPPQERANRSSIIGGVFYQSCQCTKRNGLQDECRKTTCGNPMCPEKPTAICGDKAAIGNTPQCH